MMLKRGKRNLGFIILLLCLVMALCFSACGDDGANGNEVSVYELTFETYLPLSDFAQPINDYLNWLEKESNGRIKISTRNWGGTVFSAEEVLSATGYGSADIAWASPLYTPSEQPLENLAELPFYTGSVEVIAKALTDLYENYEPFTKDFTNNNVVLCWKGPGTNMVLGTTYDVTSPEDLDGKQIRSNGTLFSNALKNAGAIPVNLSTSDLAEALSRGTVEGFAEQPITNVALFEESLKTVINPKIGPYGIGHVIMNADVFNSLPEDLQELITASRYLWVDKWHETAELADVAAWEAIRSNEKLNVVEFTDEQFEQWYKKMKVEEELQKIVDNTNAIGVDATTFIETLRETIKSYQ